MFPSTRFRAIKCPDPNCALFCCLFDHRKFDETARAVLCHTATQTDHVQVEIPANPTSLKRLPISEQGFVDQKRPKAAMKSADISRPVVSPQVIARPSNATAKRSSIAVPEGGPKMLPSMSSIIPKAARQKALDVFYAQYLRIFQPILESQPEIAHEHAIKQELQVYEKSDVKSYQIFRNGAHSKLLKRPICTGITDVGIMGEWKAPPILKAEFKLGMISCDLDAKAVQKLVMTNKELQDHGYPMHGTLALQNIQELALDTTDGEELKACERCGEKFRLGAIADSQECNYHPIRPRQRLVEGAKERFYPCCNKTINLPGCTLWHHVFKEESIAKLHESCQFTTLPPVESNSFKQELIALDCEMVYTTVGFELGRITVVDYSGALLFDTLCKPENPVIDYNTRFSGITDFDSEPTMSLGQVKDALAKLADQSTIIIGHGLENDLLVLRVFMFNRQLIHENVIDTVQVYPHPQGLPFRNSLARLMQQELKRTIQADASGHDSLQDAKSCIELLVHYLARPSKR